MESGFYSASGSQPPEFFSPFSKNNQSRVKQVWAVGGGKGGVGKSLIASNLAISLSRLGNEVITIDLDLGGANLHTALGIDLPQQTLSDFIKERSPSLNQCVVPTGIPHLSMISGAQDSMDIVSLSSTEKERLVQNLKLLDADYVVLDLGAGTNFNTLDFFIMSDTGLIALLPEPTSIENAYRFIKGAYYRRLKMNPHLAKIHPLIEAASDAKNSMGIRTPSDLFREANRLDPEIAMRLKLEITKFQPRLIVNQARTQADIDIGSSVKTVCKRYFGIEIQYVGYLDYDPAAWQAVRRKRPLMLEFPNSKLALNLEKITQQLIKQHSPGSISFL